MPAFSLLRLVAKHRKFLALTIYAGAAASSYVIAHLLRFEFQWPAELTWTFLVTLPVLLAVRALSGSVFKIAVGSWRYVGVGDVVRLLGATGLGTALFFFAVKLMPLDPTVPRSIILLEWVLTTYVTAGIWFTYRLAYELLRQRDDPYRLRVAALIVGAGEAGSGLAREMLRRSTGYRPIAFLDDSPLTWGTTVHGVEVMGSTEDLSSVATQLGVQEIVVAIPSAEPEDLRRIMESCHATDLPTKVLPGIAEVLAGEAKLDQLREVRIEDLLGRAPIILELPELAADLEGRSILVTGAAGSIGSELVRQVAAHGPERIILYDQAETDLYHLELELRHEHPDLEIVPTVADILDTDALDGVFRQYRPSRVFHAAAYKHVPLMQSNPREAVRNNVIGTMRVADAAGRFGAGKFVLISTDKAVRPTSVMGATKRVAELVTLRSQQRFPSTWFVAVRFGNVLGSQGSVIPLFQKQLEDGKPLTVTHAEVERFFMTIPEATQLVLQSSLLPEAKGMIVMLEMGEPVRILDLARKLIRLAGREEGVDTEVEFIGLRPGEKMSEELTAPNEVTASSSIDKIRLVQTDVSDKTFALLEPLAAAVEGGADSLEPDGIRRALRELLSGGEVHLKRQAEDESVELASRHSDDVAELLSE